MRFPRLPRFTYANIMSTIAVCSLLGGTAVAATAITGANIADGSIAGIDIKDGSVASIDVANASISETDLASSVVTKLNASNATPATTRGVGYDADVTYISLVKPAATPVPYPLPMALFPELVLSERVTVATDSVVTFSVAPRRVGAGLKGGFSGSCGIAIRDMAGLDTAPKLNVASATGSPVAPIVTPMVELRSGATYTVEVTCSTPTSWEGNVSVLGDDLVVGTITPIS